MKLRFGKYVGKDISEVPEHYLRWLIDTDSIWSAVKEMAQDELILRQMSENYLKIMPADYGHDLEILLHLLKI